VDSRTSDVSIFMCSGGVHWILVYVWRDDSFVILDCYVYAAFSIVMYVRHFLYVGFWRLPGQVGR
jgi:hypothetical protein